MIELKVNKNLIIEEALLLKEDESIIGATSDASNLMDKTATKVPGLEKSFSDKATDTFNDAKKGVSDKWGSLKTNEKVGAGIVGGAALGLGASSLDKRK